MIHVRSMLAGGSHRADEVAAEWLPKFADHFPVKLYWFLSRGYRPHEWQAVFHASSDVYEGTRKLVRFRHLVAGRRGGKTFSAAWEVLFYALHPREFFRDAHGQDNERPLWIYMLAKDHKLGRPMLHTFLQVINQAGLVKGRDYDFNKTEKVFTFFAPDGSVASTIEVRSADDPQSLRGAGLDILWIDESAMVPNREAWDVVRPALSDMAPGILITTTTPKGRNWFYEEFWSEKALNDIYQARVEYVSIDNPYFSRLEWEYARDNLHPVVFAQEYLASFDAMTGLTLHGPWLKYWVHGKPEANSEAITLPKDKDGRAAIRLFIGIDPAISLSDDADSFAMALIGLSTDNTQAFLMDTFLGKIDFPDQLDKIQEWFLKYRPERIGIESNAFQKALAQMAARMEGLPPVIPVFSKGDKNERIITMSPLFKIGKVRIHERHNDFIEQWINFDGAKKNQKDDLLDAVEIALGVAGVLLPMMPHETLFDDMDRPTSIAEEARLQLIAARNGSQIYDPDLGAEA